MSYTVALLVSDIHLSHKAPIARAGEEDWYRAMNRNLLELHKLKRKYKVPIICGGDLFHTWKEPAELVNWAIDNLPELYSIPGQHDLPHHDYKQIHRSVYWTLVQAGVVTNLPPGEDYYLNDELVVTAFPWGCEVHPPEGKCDSRVRLCVSHEYMWKSTDTSTKHAKAEDSASDRGRRAAFTGYDAVLLGDNHTPWRDDLFFNPGSFLRRSVPEMKYPTNIGILWSDGTVTSEPFDQTQDVFSIDHLPDEETRNFIELNSFLDELKSVNETLLDFKSSVRAYAENPDTSPLVRNVLLEIMESLS